MAIGQGNCCQSYTLFWGEIKLGIQEIRKRAMMISGLTCLWDIRATKIMIQRKHINNYERRIQYNKSEYSASTGLYCTAEDFKVKFFMPE